MLALVVAGEQVFGLPFHTARFFKPTMLEVFHFTNTQLGDLFAIFGTTAMLSYFPGGAIADRISARTLMSVALFATSVGGLYMATIPGQAGMAVLYGFWGITTSFLLWGALIRATREWGGETSQGVAFGILDGGRGIVAAIVALLAVTLLAFFMPENVEFATDAERETGFRNVILWYSLVTFLAGLLTWLATPAPTMVTRTDFRPWQGMGLVMRRPIVWAQAAVIVCAYCTYKGLDNYSLYAVQVLGMDEIKAAGLTANMAWSRPIAALTAGIIADRFDATRSIGVIFALLCVSYWLWSTVAPVGSQISIVYLNFVFTYFAVFALRGIYFALLEENRTPKNLTGAAVGIVSLVGFTPDIFFAPIAGRILDANPGLVGHQNYFEFLAAISLVGVLVVFWLLWLHRHGAETLWPRSKIATN